jgi:alanyl aminopeptidase
MRFMASVLLFAIGCGGAAPAPSAPSPTPATPTPVAAAPSAPAPAPPGLRLGDDVVPTRYDLDLTIDPLATTTSGAGRIGVKVNKPTQLIWLHAQNLTVATVSFASADGKSFPGTVIPAADGMMGFGFPQPLPTGAGTIAVEWKGVVVENEDSGLFRQKEGDAWYAYTQFETSSARRVFPSFDEPRFKTPFKLTVRTPPANAAFANTALEAERAAGNFKVFVFGETKPLPTYLVAMAVGPFEVVPVEEGSPRHPTRIIVPRGHAKGVSYMRQVAAPVLHIAEDYFGIPYPFGKIDIVAIPTLISFSAMEHPGLITFRLGLVSQRDDDWSGPEKRRTAAILAHEYAHQWFGNLVTPVWWDDIWLNEGFASWMANKMMKSFAPTWDVHTATVAERIEAMTTDSLSSARKVRQEIKGGDDIANAFDRISYAKGLALLAMFEAWSGEEPFRNGIRRYLAAHSFGNATSKDFLAAIAADAGAPLAPAFETFLSQPGIPLVSMDLACEKGKPPRILLGQSRYSPAGSKSSEETWQVPVCVRWGDGKSKGRQCHLLGTGQAELPLEATKCPTWIAPNANGDGYYHVAPSKALLPKILASRAQLSAPERLQLTYDLFALSRTGQASPADTLAFAAPLAREDNRYVLLRVIEIFGDYSRYLPDDQQAAYARYVLGVFGPRARALGWSPRKSEPDEQIEVRALVVGTAANLGEDPMLTLAARKHLDAWLDDPKTLSALLFPQVAEAAARNGDAALFDRLVAAAKKSEDRIERARILTALGKFRAPALAERARELAISGDFEVREAARVLFDQMSEPTQKSAAWAWYRKNLDRIVKVAPRGGGAYMALVGNSFCDAEARKQFVETFEERNKKALGGPRVYAQVLERIDQCIAMRQAHGPALAKLISKRK